MKKGYQRVKIDGRFYEIAEAPALDKKFTHDIDVVVDRIVVRPDIAARLADSLEQALKLADGLAVAELADVPSPSPLVGEGRGGGSGGGATASTTAERPSSSARRLSTPTPNPSPQGGGEHTERAKANRQRNETAERLTFSEKFACPVSGFTIPEIEPRLFSFNNPFGACPKCGGLGVEQHIDADLVIPDKERTLRKGAIAPWAKSSSPYYTQTLSALGKHYKFTLDTKWKDLPKKTQDAILYGSGDSEIRFSYDDGLRAYDTRRAFEGVVTNLERRFKETDSDWAREEIARYFTDVPCAACNGYRLKPEALCVKVGGLHIGQVSDMSVKGAAAWFTELPQRLTSKQNEIAVRVLKEIRERLKFLVDVGLGIPHAGARQRHPLRRREPAHSARLADRLRPHRRALRARRAVDRPAPARQCAPAGNPEAPARPRQHRDRGRARRGRHPHRRLRARHRPRRRHPRRPRRGARRHRRSHRRADIHGPANISPANSSCRSPSAEPRNPRRTLKIVNARGNNLKNITAEIPLGLFTCVTGVSGGGKSTLLDRHALQGAGAAAERRQRGPRPHDRIEGVEHLDKIIDIDQSPIGRTPRS